MPWKTLNWPCPFLLLNSRPAFHLPLGEDQTRRLYLKIVHELRPLWLHCNGLNQAHLEILAVIYHQSCTSQRLTKNMVRKRQIIKQHHNIMSYISTITFTQHFKDWVEIAVFNLSSPRLAKTSPFVHLINIVCCVGRVEIKIEI